jgi:Ca-activated chloride channel family protein
LERFFYDLLDPADEMFLIAFSGRPDLVQDWTADRNRLSKALRQVSPRGDTALYDAVADAAPLAQTGSHRKKAILLISDGNDTSSQTDARELKAILRDSEALVYAIGIDGRGDTMISRGQSRPPIPFPFPIPGRRGPVFFPPGGGGGPRVAFGDALNVGALREITDDSGGRTEVVRSARDLEPATASIADELSRQYYIGYPAAAEKDGRWHTIRVEVKSRNYRVRARRGYLAATS